MKIFLKSFIKYYDEDFFKIIRQASINSSSFAFIRKNGFSQKAHSYSTVWSISLYGNCVSGTDCMRSNKFKILLQNHSCSDEINH